MDQLRIIEGIEIAFLLYQTGNPDEYKVSLRTNSAVDVSRIALSFGGGMVSQEMLDDDGGAAGDRGEDQRKDPRAVGRAQVTNTGGKNVRRNY